MSPLGAGGMGEVYKARDTRLDRTVALKVLPETLADDPQFRERFDREARTISQLSHPHICPLFDVGHQDGVHFLVMEFLDGETLADRLQGGPVSLADALRIGVEIAGALDAAHRQGIIHRDLKPGNVMLTKAGAKLLDFGLAKSAPLAGTAGSSLTSPPTRTTPLTVAGSILGTIQYMSPEQLEGVDADARSDIFAFGAVLYEMITGKKAFAGKSQVSVMAAILDHDPPSIANLQPTTPAALVRLVNTCLAKDPEARWQNARDLARELEWITAAPAVEDRAPTQARSSGVRFGVAVIAAVVVAAISALATWLVVRQPMRSPQAMRFAITPPASQQLGPMLNGVRQLAISPDGKHLAYIAFGGIAFSVTQLMIRTIDQLDPVPSRGPITPRAPFFSPDGKWIGYFDPVGGLQKVSVTGGPPITICTFGAGPRGGTWTSDDTIVFATNDPSLGLQSVAAAGGTPKLLLRPDPARGELLFAQPSALPNGRGVLFTVAPSTAVIENAQVAVLDSRSGERKTLIRGGLDATYVEPSPGQGYLVYAAAGALRAIRFDLEKLEVSGEAVPIVDQVVTMVGAAQYAVSRNGTFVYVPGTGVISNAARTVAWIDRSGRETAIPSLPPRAYAWARVSPDGAKLALDIRDQEQDVWIFDLTRSILRRLTMDPSIDGFPLWTSDGRRIVFESNRSHTFQVYAQAADGTGTAQQLTKGPNPMWPYSLSPDGTRVVIQETTTETGTDLDVVGLDGASPPQPLIRTRFAETNAEISPDGRWIAYQSNQSGADEIYVRPFPNVNDGHWQVSPAGGTIPAWNANGRELFYVSRGSMMTVPLQTTSTTFGAGNPTKLFDIQTPSTPPMRYYDVTRDGQKFVVIKDPPLNLQAATPTMVVVVNWFEELKAKVGVR